MDEGWQMRTRPKTGMKSVREVEEYVVHPNELKSLKMGQALLVCTKVDPHFCIMKIDLASKYSLEYVKTAVSDAGNKHSRQVDNSCQLKVVEELQPKDLA